MPFVDRYQKACQMTVTSKRLRWSQIVSTTRLLRLKIHPA